MFIPKADTALSITLPGEILRAQVTKVLDQNTVLVELGQPMMRSHSYRMGDLVACRRTPGVLGETWQVIEERRTAPDMTTLTEQPKPRKTGPKPSNVIASKTNSGNNRKVDTLLVSKRSGRGKV